MLSSRESMPPGRSVADGGHAGTQPCMRAARRHLPVTTSWPAIGAHGIPASTAPRSHRESSPGPLCRTALVQRAPARARNGTAPATVGREPAFTKPLVRTYPLRLPARCTRAASKPETPRQGLHANREGEGSALPEPFSPGSGNAGVSICQSGDLPTHQHGTCPHHAAHTSRESCAEPAMSPVSTPTGGVSGRRER